MVTQAGNPGNRDDILESERRLNQRVADEDRRRRELADRVNRENSAEQEAARFNRAITPEQRQRQQLSDQQAEAERQRVIEVANELLEFQERVADRRRARDAERATAIDNALGQYDDLGERERAFIRGQLEVRAVLDPEEYNAEIGDLSRQYQDELLNSFSTAGGIRGYVQDVSERISETSQSYGAVNTEGIAERFTTIFPQYRGREDDLARVIDTPEFAGIVNGIRATLAVGGDTAVDFIPIVGTLRQADELAEFWRNLSTEERLLGAGLLGLSVALEFVPGPEIRPNVRPRGGGPDVGTGRRGDVPRGGGVGAEAGNTAEFVRVLPDGSVEVPGGALSVSNVADPSFQMALLRGGAPSPSDLVRDVPNPIVLRPNLASVSRAGTDPEFRETTVVDSEGRPINFSAEGIIIPRAVDNPGQVTATEENLGAKGGSGASGVVPGVGEGAGVGSTVGERTTTQAETGVQAGVDVTTTDVTATRTGVETAVGADVATGVGARTAVEPGIRVDDRYPNRYRC